ncbi:MAG TPA: hypothetical protein VIM58_02065, partial [Candidatus Methylacidiphilales bacterium]
TQNVSLGAVTGFGVLNTSSTAGTATTVVSSTATVGAVTNAVDSLTVSSTNANANTVVQLGSNLNFAGGSYATPFYFSLANNMTASVDLHGFSYNAAAGTASTVFSPTGSTAGTSSYIAITNTGGSSIAGNQGVFKAAAIDLSNADVSLGSGVIVQATVAGSVNDLGQKDAGATTNVNAGSTFYYNTAGTATLKSTNGRTLGAVQVGDGSTAATLRLGSAITAAGNVTAAASATVDLNGSNLVLSGAASLTGTGTIANTNASAASIVSFAAGATGGLSAAGSGTAGNLTFTAGTKPLTLQLANSTSTIDILSAGLGAGTYDTITLNGAGLDLTGSALNINFGAGTYNGSIQLFNLQNGATITGLPATITSNLGGLESLSLNSSGVLSFNVVAVPEPSTVVLGIGGSLFLCGVCRKARRLAEANA